MNAPRAFRVLIHVQHLLGSGHLQRCLLLARALTERGCEVLMFSGGPPVPTLDTAGIDFRQLPVLRSRDSSFSELVDAEGRLPDAQFFAHRLDLLRDGLSSFQPHALLVESWPFARRKLSAEVLGLLQAAAGLPAPPLRFCSIRDVLQQHGKPERYREAVARVRSCIDHVLVHVDPEVIRLQASFPLADEIADRIEYTGFVGRDLNPVPEIDRSSGEILVSAGGGAVGQQLLEAALAAARQPAMAGWRWRLLVSHAFAEPVFVALRASAPATVLVERNRPDFVELLQRCRVSVSQAGYNTLVEILQTGAPAVLVPFAAERETEQLQRAQAFAAAGFCLCLPEARLSGDSLAEAVQAASVLSRPAVRIDLGGASHSADCILQHLAVSSN